MLLLTGITATVGIGTNLYLTKVAMDIVAKKAPADENGVRIAELDEFVTGNSGIHKVCLGKQNTSGGLHWRYA